MIAYGDLCVNALLQLHIPNGAGAVGTAVAFQSLQPGERVL